MTDISATGRVLAWGDAITEYEVGNTGPLVNLIRSEPVPEVIAAELADAIERGPRRPRNADKRRLTVSQRRELAWQWREIQRVLDQLRSAAQENEQGLEPSEVLKIASRWREQLLCELRDKYGVSDATIRKITAPEYRQIKRVE